MLKKDVLGKASAKSLDEAFKCGECIHFQNSPHPGKKTICKELGVRAVGIAPSCFTPDITQIAQNTDQLVAVSSLMHSYSTKQKRILLAVLRGNKPGKHKMPFGTKVYFRAMGGDYISNYLSGIVVGYSSAGELMVSGNPVQHERGRAYISYFSDTETLLTRKEWLVKRKELREKHRLNDPKTKRIMKTVTQDHEPPTLDEAPASWHDKREQTRKRTRTSELEFKIS